MCGIKEDQTFLPLVDKFPFTTSNESYFYNHFWKYSCSTFVEGMFFSFYLSQQKIHSKSNFYSIKI